MAMVAATVVLAALRPRAVLGLSLQTGPTGRKGARATRRLRKRRSKETVVVRSPEELEVAEAEGFPAVVMGDAQQPLGLDHPTLEIIRRRKAEGSLPGQRRPDDKAKVALVIEGGGMRGCVTAGMATALLYHGFLDSFDDIYGASAGTMIGAYLMTDPPLDKGISLYTDLLTDKSMGFIDKRQIWRALGLGLLGLSVTGFRGLKDLFSEPIGTPPLNLDFLLVDALEKLRPLDFAKFQAKDSVQPLHLVASGIDSLQAITLTSQNGNFFDLPSLRQCMRASMLLPALCGPPVQPPNCSEPLVDAQLFGAIPFESAVGEGATHVMTLRSRPDGVAVGTKQSVLETTMLRRFFKRKLGHPEVYDYMKHAGHRRLYADNILQLNAGNRGVELCVDGHGQVGTTDPTAVSRASGLSIAVPAGCQEIGRLEQRREAILTGVHQGFAQVSLALEGKPAPNREELEASGAMQTVRNLLP